MDSGRAIVIGALIVAGAVLFLFRWSLVIGPTTGERTEIPLQGIYRLDRWTGDVTWCRGVLPGMLAPSKINCEAK